LKPLTQKEEVFCQEYVKDFNGTRAALAAGYAKKSAAQFSTANLKKPNVQEKLESLKAEIAKKNEIDATYVLKRLVEIDKMDALDILTDDGFVKPISQWPLIWRQFISGFEVTESFLGVDPSKRGPKPKNQKDDARLVGMLKKVKWPDKVKNLELIGRHVNVMAFRENLSLTGKDGKDLLPTVIFLPAKEKI